ncbi:fimbrial protein [Buttiauxella izardii]|uniref:Type 1 fimbrial protein n=1 Tax=Buttiauxella izardii TaxID=82991 RepID=A0A3A5K5Y6_9ENTR|nr:fimbrial protein [Buttiauxella izardii]RJT27979.1 type 1 fimbrial protein [Buttiauxella izardii]
MINKKHHMLLLLAGLFVSTLAVTQNAYAVCPAVSLAPPPAAINVDAKVAIGAVVGTTTVTFPDATYGCSPQVGQAMYIWKGYGTPNGNIYPTHAPGLGYRLKFGPGIWPDYMGTDYFPLAKYRPDQGAQTGMHGGTLIIEFIKLGPVGNDPIPAQTLAVYGVGLDLNDFDKYVHIDLAGDIPVIEQHFCTADSVVNVPLDDVYTNELSLSNPGAKPKDFQIKINCPTQNNISLLFTGDMQDAANAVFKNTDPATASSVGVQILRNGSPVPNGNGNNINLGNVTGNLTTLFTARYYALATPVAEGAVTSVAYATIMYN